MAKISLGDRILKLLEDEGNKQRSIRYISEALDVTGPGVMYAAENLKKDGKLMLWMDRREWAVRLPVGGHSLRGDSSVQEFKDLASCLSLVKNHWATIIEQRTEITDLKAKAVEVLKLGGGLENDNLVGKLRAKLGEKNLVIENLKSNLREAARVEHKLTKDVDAKLGELHDQIAEKDGKIGKLEVTVILQGGKITDKDKKIGLLRLELDKLCVERRSEDLRSAIEDTTSVKMKENLEKQEKTIAELRCNLNEADMLIGVLRKKIEEHVKHISDLEQDMAFQGLGDQDEGRALSETEVLFLREEVLFLRGVVDRLLPEKKLGGLQCLRLGFVVTFGGGGFFPASTLSETSQYI